MEAEQPTGGSRRRRSTSVQRMLDLEKKFKMDRLRSAPPEAKPRPILLTDPPPRKRKPVVPTGATTLTAKSSHSHGNGADDANPKATQPALSDVTHISYSARARESVGTTAASHQTVALTKASRSSDDATSEAESSICQSPSWDTYDRRCRKDKKQKEPPAEKPVRAARLVKPPPSASRTPQLWVRSSTGLPMSMDHHNSAASETPDVPPPPPPPPKDGKFYTTRGRSNSRGSINSVSSIASKIRSSLELPRGRSANRESGSSFLGGKKFWGGKAPEAELHASRLSDQNATSYSLPARYMYRQPAGSSVTHGNSRSSSCSVTSSGSLAPHMMANPPALSFPLQQRNRGPPVSLKTPTPIARSRSSSRSGSCSPPDAHHGGLDDGTNVQGAGAHSEEVGSSVGPGGRSPRASSVPSPRREVYPANGSRSTSPGVLGRKKYPPLASAHVLASMATKGGEKAGPSRRRSLLGRVRGRRAADGDNPHFSDTSIPPSDDEPRAQATTRNFRDAARAAFRRSTSRASSFRGGSPASEVPPAGSPTRAVVGPCPDISSVNPTSNAASTFASATRIPQPSSGPGPGTPSGSSPLRNAPELFRRPRPIIDPYTMRPSDRSSVSSYETAQSLHQSSMLTPNTSRPQSEKGVVNNSGAADGQKVLPTLPGGDEKPPPPFFFDLSSGLALGAAGGPPVAEKSPRRMLRNSVGSETHFPSPTQGVFPTVNTASAIPASSVTTHEIKARSEGVAGRRKAPSSLEHIAVGMQVRPVPPPDPSMFPKPLNVSPASDNPAENQGQQKLRRQAKSPHFAPDEPIRHGSAHGSEGASVSAPTSHMTAPREKWIPTAPPTEVLRHGDPPPLRFVQSPKPAAGRGKDRTMGLVEAEPLKKVLVRCCGCGHLHDPPTRIYERMMGGAEASLQGEEGNPGDKGKYVRCPWCRHVMRMKCCAGYVAVVQLKERLH